MRIFMRTVLGFLRRRAQRTEAYATHAAARS
jgi:hypothetical protein